MPWIQKAFSLKPRPRGFHIVTGEIMAAVPEISSIRVGLAHLFIQHTSASLSINENADPDVRVDFESHMNRMIPDGAPHFIHTLEGPDDMAAHIKASVLDTGLTIPIRKGALALGTWQGIYLCEHRDSGGARQVVATIQGEHDE